ncbi:MAG: hypothetical protein GTO14_07300 [Anaerolineales bacterium]|nr:hypothetical protein [Anaerolineales bacterium]
MSMQALNQLVARSIIDPGVVQAFSAGRMDELVAEMGFAPAVRQRLSQLEAGSWAEFAVLAYRIVQAVEVPALRIELPSPLTGLLPDQSMAEGEQAA